VPTVLFYHLTRSSVEQTARLLLARAVGQGWKVTVRGGRESRLDDLDRVLWLGPEGEFLPHGRSGGAHDARQPILLTGRHDLANDPKALMLLDGAAFDEEETVHLERVWILFEDQDTACRDTARDQWKRICDAGIAAQYWTEDGGSWEKKMERAPVARPA
jgi:DNA polymerase-3 subunit chi